MFYARALVSLLALAPAAIFAQSYAFPPITVSVAVNPNPLVTCGSATVQWSMALTSTNVSVGDVVTSVDATYFGLWAESTSTTNPASVNLTTTDLPLQPLNGVMMVVWNPVTLPANSGQWIIYLRSTPGHVGGLDVSAQSAALSISPGTSDACLAPLVASSSASVSSTSVLAATTSTTSTSGTSTILGATAAAAHTGSTNHAGAIAGGVLGGVLGLAIIAFLCFAWAMHKRKQRRRREAANRTKNSRTPSSYEDREKGDVGLSKYGGILAAIGITTAHNSRPSTNYDDTTGTTHPASPEPQADGASRKNLEVMATGAATGTGAAATNRHSQASATTFASLQQFPVPPTSPTSLGGTAEAQRASMRGSWIGPSAAGAMSSSGPRPPSPTATSSSETHTSTAPATAAVGAPLGRSNTGGGNKVQRKAPPQIPDGLSPNTPTAATFPESATSTANTDPPAAAPGPVESTAPSAYYNASGVRVGAPSISTESYHTAIGQGSTSSLARPSMEVERGHDGRTLARTSGHEGGFAAYGGFAGAKDGPVHYLIPDMPNSKSP